MDPFGADFIHTVVEAAKLAYADREAYYGDPNFCRVPLEDLLSDDYNAERRRLIGARRVDGAAAWHASRASPRWWTRDGAGARPAC